jgi:hypothetical protein
VNLKIEIEREDNGRWLAEVPELSGVMAYGQWGYPAAGPRDPHAGTPER